MEWSTASYLIEIRRAASEKKENSAISIDIHSVSRAYDEIEEKEPLCPVRPSSYVFVSPSIRFLPPPFHKSKDVTHKKEPTGVWCQDPNDKDIGVVDTSSSSFFMAEFRVEFDCSVGDFSSSPSSFFFFSSSSSFSIHSSSYTMALYVYKKYTQSFGHDVDLIQSTSHLIHVISLLSVGRVVAVRVKRDVMGKVGRPPVVPNHQRLLLHS